MKGTPWRNIKGTPERRTASLLLWKLIALPTGPTPVILVSKRDYPTHEKCTIAKIVEKKKIKIQQKTISV